MTGIVEELTSRGMNARSGSADVGKAVTKFRLAINILPQISGFLRMTVPLLVCWGYPRCVAAGPEKVLFAAFDSLHRCSRRNAQLIARSL
jgi:hypothetical protein